MKWLAKVSKDTHSRSWTPDPYPSEESVGSRGLHDNFRTNIPLVESLTFSDERIPPPLSSFGRVSGVGDVVGTLACLFSNSICTVNGRSQRHAKCMPECLHEC